MGACGVAIALAALVMFGKIAQSIGLSDSLLSEASDASPPEAVASASMFAVCGVLACGGVLGVRRRLEQVQRSEWRTPAISRKVAAFAAFGVAMSVSWLVH